MGVQVLHEYLLCMSAVGCSYVRSRRKCAIVTWAIALCWWFQEEIGSGVRFYVSHAISLAKVIGSGADRHCGRLATWLSSMQPGCASPHALGWSESQLQFLELTLKASPWQRVTPKAEHPGRG